MRNGGCPAGSSRALRLDPFALPVRFAASDAAADGRVRDIELHRERVVVRRSVRGMHMALNMPLTAFAGVALRVMTGEGGADGVAVVLAPGRAAVALLGPRRATVAEHALDQGASAHEAAALAAGLESDAHRRALVTDLTVKALNEAGRA